jgi:hypothetical protein
MKNVVSFSGLAKAMRENALEPVVEVIGLIKTTSGEGVEFNLSSKGDKWISLMDTDVHDSVEYLADKEIKNKESNEVAAQYPVVRLRLQKDASKELMWAVIQKLQSSLHDARAAYEGELRRKSKSLEVGDTLTRADCTCTEGDKCCCPDGWKCANYDKRCGCSSS